MEDVSRDLDWLRRQFVIALAADDDLFHLLVFKGGNALTLAHQIGMRTSLDLDYSMAEEAASDEDLGRSLNRALVKHLAKQGLTLFDWKFSPRPRVPASRQAQIWGGYEAEFKVIETEVWDRLSGNLEHARRRAWGISSSGGSPRKFRIELSRSEFCEGAAEKDVGDGFVVRVYTPAMIAIEKLRSICQQMPEYAHSTKRKPRARDFYDIHAVAIEANVNLASHEYHELVRSVFSAKDVPLRLLAHMERDLPFHKGDWDSVRISLPPTKSDNFEFYANFVIDIAGRLQCLWVEDAP